MAESPTETSSPLYARDNDNMVLGHGEGHLAEIIVGANSVLSARSMPCHVGEKGGQVMGMLGGRCGSLAPHFPTIPDTTGSPEVTSPPDQSHKRPAEDDDEAGSTECPTAPARRTKRQRRMYTPEQVQVLEKTFQASEYPTSEDRVILSSVTQLSTEKVKVWFQNRRSRERRRRQNQTPNDTTMKQTMISPVIPQPKQQPSYQQNPQVSVPSVTKPYAAAVGTRAPLPSPTSTTTVPQQWVQLWHQTGPQGYPTHTCPVATARTMADDNNNVLSMGPSGPTSPLLKPLSATGSMKHQFPNMYTKLRPTSIPATVSSSIQKDIGLGASPGKCDLEPSYAPLVPAWSQSWPMFPSQASSNMNTPIQKVLPLCQPTDSFCGDANKWVENHSNNLQTGGGYGMGPTEVSNKALQEHYSYAAMIPTGYLHYGYPYYTPGMYQPSQMGLYQQSHVAAPASSMGPYLGADVASPPSISKAHPSVVSQSVRLALQRKLDSSQKNSWQQQYNQPVSGRLPAPYQMPQKLCENDAFSDSSTLSSPERGGSPSKPLATSSPTGTAPCSILFPMSDKDGGQELFSSMGVHDPWTPSDGMTEPMDKNNNMDIGASTPYPNVAGYYNDYAPITTSSYSQPSMSTWDSARVPNVGGNAHFPYKFPDWPAMQLPDRMTETQPMSTATDTKTSDNYPYTIAESLAPVASHSSQPQEITPCKDYQSSPQLAADVVTAVCGSAVHSDISSYGGSGDEHNSCEMAPQEHLPQPIKDNEKTNQQDGESSTTADCTAAASLTPSHVVYDIDSDTE